MFGTWYILQWKIHEVHIFYSHFSYVCSHTQRGNNCILQHQLYYWRNQVDINDMALKYVTISKLKKILGMEKFYIRIRFSN